jgi:3-oxoadipate enol-lactonase
MVYPLRSCAIGTQRSFLIDFTCGVPEAGSQKRGRPLRRLGGATPPSGEAAGAGAGAEGGRVTTDLHVESAGDGGPAVVLVHAGIADVRMWDREFAALADRHRVVRYDVRGFGRSPDPTRDYFDHDDLLAVLDDAGLDRAVLVGASNGGRIVLDAAITAPGRVQALVLVGSALPGVPLGADVEADFDAEGEALMAGDVDRAREINLRWWVDGVGRDPSAVDPSVRAMVTGWLDELLPRQAAQMAAARGDAQLVEPPVRDRLANIDVPALVLVGRHDAPGMDVIARHLVAGLPQAHLVEIEGAAHLPNLEQPDRFAGLLGRFLASLEA